MPEARPLSEKPCRDDFTDRECVAILGATIGGLLRFASKEDLRNAILWWIDNFDGAYALMESGGVAAMENSQKS